MSLAVHRIEIACASCGDLFTVRPRQLPRSKFCSRHCRGVGSGKSLHTALSARYPAELSVSQTQLLIGGLLGDGCVMYTSAAARECIYSETHSSAQVDYLRWKAERLVNFGARVVEHRPANRSIGYQLKTGRAAVFTALRETFYPSGIKAVPSNETLDAMGALGLAVWFMDDGSFRWQARCFRLATDSFTRADNERLILWFGSRHCVRPRLTWHTTKHTWSLTFRVADSLILLRHMDPHLHQMFRTKWRSADTHTFRPLKRTA